MLSIVISAYNEEGNVVELHRQLTKHLRQFSNMPYEILFVNDGSKDKTLEKCLSLVAEDSKTKIVNLSRNFGHEIAMSAGLDYAKYETVLFMDADLQHPPSLVPEIIKKWQEGNEIVLTKRINNDDKKLFGKFCNYIFYKIINLLSEVPIPANSPDFRLIGKKYVNMLRKINERERMFRGLLNWIGFSKAAIIEFNAPKRFSGKTHYNFLKLVSLAVASVAQFSNKPLRIITYIALGSVLFALSFMAYTIFEHFYYHQQSNGYTTIICIIAIFSSIQMVMLGILAEYIGIIHIETKARPLYFAELIEN